MEPRFAAGGRLPAGAGAAADGGLSRPRRGSDDRRGHELVTGSCVPADDVRRPIDGATPDDTSVRALSHPDAYPISFVALRRLRDVTPIVAAFVTYLTGPQATASFRQRGMLLVKEPWPAVPGPA